MVVSLGVASKSRHPRQASSCNCIQQSANSVAGGGYHIVFQSNSTTPSSSPISMILLFARVAAGLPVVFFFDPSTNSPSSFVYSIALTLFFGLCLPPSSSSFLRSAASTSHRFLISSSILFSIVWKDAWCPQPSHSYDDDDYSVT